MTEAAAAEAQSLRSAADVVQGAGRIAILSHVNPDADAIGSVLGLTRGLEGLGKEVVPVLADPVPRYAQFLPGSDRISTSLPADAFDLYLFVDAAEIDRIGRVYNPDRFAGTRILNVDHHRTNPLFGTVNYVDAAASSSAEVAYRLLMELGAPIDAGTASALLFGIVGDTGSFQNGATTPGALETAARLLARGADSQRIAYQLFEYKTFAAAQLWGRVLSSIELDRGRRIVLACMSHELLRETGATPDEAEGIAEYLRGIEEASVVMLLKEQETGEIRVSMRSRPQVDVAAIATSLGGGGHRQAAGCTVAGPFPAAVQELLRAYDALNPSRGEAGTP